MKIKIPQLILPAFFIALVFPTVHTYPQQNLNFYPLQSGNIWFYMWTYDNKTDSAFVLESISHDTTLANGEKYFIRRTQRFKDRMRTIPLETYNKFQRVDGTNGLALQFDETEPYPGERIIYDLSADEGDTTIMDSHGLLMICTDVNDTILFNETRTIKNFSLPNTYSFAAIAEGIGESVFLTGFEFYSSEKTLLGAKISGKYFGDSSTITSINKKIVPEYFFLSQNYPNPFNPATTIQYSIPFIPSPWQGEGQRVRSVTLKVYDMLGREISTLINEQKLPGNYQIKFDGTSLPSGIYFYRLTSGSFSQTKKLVLLK